MSSILYLVNKMPFKCSNHLAHVHPCAYSAIIRGFPQYMPRAKLPPMILAKIDRKINYEIKLIFSSPIFFTYMFIVGLFIIKISPEQHLKSSIIFIKSSCNYNSIPVPKDRK